MIRNLLSYRSPYHKETEPRFKLVYNLNAYCTSNNTLKSLSGNPEDNVEIRQKSRICKMVYKIYARQTKESMKTRYKEDVAHFQFG